MPKPSKPKPSESKASTDQSTTGKLSGREWFLQRQLPPDDPIFKKGWMVGHTSLRNSSPTGGPESKPSPKDVPSGEQPEESSPKPPEAMQMKPPPTTQTLPEHLSVYDWDETDPIQEDHDIEMLLLYLRKRAKPKD